MRKGEQVKITGRKSIGRGTMKISREEEANLQHQLTLDDDEALHALLKRLMPDMPLDAVEPFGRLLKNWTSDRIQVTRVVAGKKVVQILRLKPKQGGKRRPVKS